MPDKVHLQFASNLLGHVRPVRLVLFREQNGLNPKPRGCQHFLFDPAHSHANWEQTGIVTDIEAYADWDTYTFETDPAIAAALTLLGHK